MEKYTTTNESIKIKNCYNSIPKQLGKDNKNFKYSEIQKGKDKKYFGNSIHWLTNSNVVLRVNNTEAPRVPLEFRKDENILDMKIKSSQFHYMQCGVLNIALMEKSSVTYFC
ncbi:MAG: hypothetical protein IJ593_06440 [Lachnospiraceae bacterium]|nr:hypothetical protein [Lachnospiraceae bacterium]